MLKTSENIKSMTQLEERWVGVGGGSRVGRDGSEFDKSKVDSNEIRDDKIGKKIKNCLSSKICLSPKKQ